MLLLILVFYLALGSLYALYTPAWQAPDEPAHYNYVRYLADNGRFPVLHPGDYPHAYLEQIKHDKFPPNEPVDGIRYESHQPPLYYALAAPVYLLFHGVQGPWATPAPGLLPLRLLSVLMGLPLVIITYAIGRRIFPATTGPALAAAAFVAFLPRQLAAVAQAGNDGLVELLLAVVLLVLVRWLTAPATAGHENRRLLALGILLGLIAITKTTAYFAIALILAVMIWHWRRTGARPGRIAADLSLVAAPAALLALPWYARDISVYGWPDFLGLRMHDMIVTGQMRPADFLAQKGAAEFVRQLIVVTFESFWAVFGWQGVFLDIRIYEGLALLSAAVLAGLVLHERQVRDPAALAPCRRYALRLLAACAALSLLTYAWYNTQFVQFQGRYLFTGLIPLAVAFALGWEAALQPRRHAFMLAAGFIVLAVLVAAAGIALGHSLPKWPVAMALAAAALFAARGQLARFPARLAAPAAGLFFALPYGVLPFFSLYCLFGAVIPQLR
ncbi:MAG TPA: glycosyltransferase family 39 protein [Anaerolineae bacterium]